MPLDSATWAALAFVLTAAGATWSYVSWRRHGLAAGLRGLAWTLVPVAAYLTGTLRLAGRVVDAFTAWAANLVFNPLVWAGIVLAGVSVVLFGVSSRMARHGIGTRVGGENRKVDRATPTKTGTLGAAGDRGEPALDDLADIQAILKKHGIS